MKKFFTLAFLLLFLASHGAGAWGRMGHDAVAAIAEANLNPRTKKIVESYLGGHSIIYYSSWMDETRDHPEYAAENIGHSVIVDENCEPMLGKGKKKKAKNTGPDCLVALLQIMEDAKDYKSLDDSTVAVMIKRMVHIVGDMHCPSHIKYPWTKTYWCGFYNIDYKEKYHKIWDDSVISSMHRWGYMEFVDQLNRLDKKEIKKITAGGPVDWARESALKCRGIYDLIDHENPYVDKDLAAFTMRPLIDEQLQKAGYRLAAVLNSIFK